MTALVTLRFGYTYATGDHDDLLPPVLATLEPSLFLDDAYVQGQRDGFTVRSAFRVLLVAAGRGLGLQAGIAFLHLAVLTSVGALLFVLARALRAGRTAAVLGALIAAVVFPTWTLGGNAIVYSLLTPEGIAWIGVLIGLLLWTKKRRYVAAAVLGVAAWFHALAGLLTLAALGLVFAWEAFERYRLWREAFSFVGIGALVASFLVMPALLRHSAELGASLPDGLDPFTLYARLRFPHHMLPGAFGFGPWIRFLVLVGLGIGGFQLARARKRPMTTTFVLRFGLAAGALALAATLGIYFAESLTAARLQSFKLSVLIAAFMSMGIGAGLAASIPRDWRKAAERVMRRPRYMMPLAAVLIGGSIVPIVKADIGDTEQVATWALTQTQPQDLFMVPPSMDGFRVPARRGVIVTWKSVPFRTDLAANWWTRLSDIAPLPGVPSSSRMLLSRLDSSYSAMNDSTRRSTGHAYGARYAILPKEADTSLPVMTRGDSWMVVDLGP